MSKKAKNVLEKVITKLVLNVLESNANQVLNAKQIAAKLNISDSESQEIIHSVLLQQALLGVVEEESHGKFRIGQVRNFVLGSVDMSSDGSAYVIPENKSATETDIYISPRKLKNALNGDLVKVYAYARNNKKRREGEVVEIVKRRKDKFTGVLQVSQQFAFLIPDDKKMFHDIFVPLSELKGAKNGDKVQVELTEWPEGAKNPVGRISYIFGQPGENETEMNAILAEYDFPLAFPEHVEQEAAQMNRTITEEEIKKRKDFRKTTTFTIDPFDAKDFDDAISFKKMPNGRYEIGVHIADVSHYVQPGSEIDIEAYNRGTSVYLVDRVIPMLPEVLSNDLCSLRPHEEKLCYSAVFEIDDQAQVHHEWFGRTVIYSDRRFTYEEVQEILEGKEGDYKEELVVLNELAHILRDDRFMHGAINFESEEVKFRLDENGKPLGVYVKERKDSHKLVEEFMLLANRKVAEFIGKKGKKNDALTFVYRAHDKPNMDNFADFSKFAAKFGYKLSMKSDRDVARSINKLMNDVVGTNEQNILSQLAIRTMAKAIYTTKESSHYGLAFDYYTHFTSPIRRYPDVMVHRLLDRYLKAGKSVPDTEIEPQCVHSSQMEKKATDAERASIKYKQAEYLKDNIGEVYEGIISGVTEWGMYVELMDNKCEGMIRLKDISDDFYTLDSKNYCIIGQRKKKKYSLGDVVKIEIKSVNLIKRQIDFKLVSSSYAS